MGEENINLLSNETVLDQMEPKEKICNIDRFKIHPSYSAEVKFNIQGASEMILAKRYCPRTFQL